MAKAPCKECRHRPKWGNRQRCITCALRHEPIGVQIEAAARRRAMVPEALRRKRTPKLMALAPAGRQWCAGCQSWRDDADFAKGSSKCRPCASAVAHASMLARVYKLTAEQYDELFALQGGRCAICRARPKSKRLAVDHDHTSGYVRGLLCSRCNHDLMGSAWDSMAMALALWHYMNTPPTSGEWRAPELGLEAPGATRPSKPSGGVADEFAVPSEKGSERPSEAPMGAVFTASDRAAGILAGLNLDVEDAHALWGALDRHLKRVDPAPF